MSVIVTYSINGASVNIRDDELTALTPEELQKRREDVMYIAKHTAAKSGDKPGEQNTKGGA